jgi:hypothetical protein
MNDLMNDCLIVEGLNEQERVAAEAVYIDLLLLNFVSLSTELPPGE